MNYVKCPVCGEDDMEQVDGLIDCTNLECASNGGENYSELKVTIILGMRVR